MAVTYNLSLNLFTYSYFRFVILFGIFFTKNFSGSYSPHMKPKRQYNIYHNIVKINERIIGSQSFRRIHIDVHSRKLPRLPSTFKRLHPIITKPLHPLLQSSNFQLQPEISLKCHLRPSSKHRNQPSQLYRLFQPFFHELSLLEGGGSIQKFMSQPLEYLHRSHSIREEYELDQSGPFVQL